jgi:polyphenol oxidase
MLERRAVEGLRVVVAADCEADGFLVAFTERHPGGSSSPFDTLNLSLAVGDDRERVGQNRDALCHAFGIDGFAVGQQVHGAGIARVEPESSDAGFRDHGAAFPATDALVTDARGVGVAVLVADCVPVALASPATGRVAVVHAGWRGTAARVMQRTLDAFGETSDIRAAIGPAIGPDHYEVGSGVIDALGGVGPVRVAERTAAGRCRVDLPGTVEAILEDRGVRRIERSFDCTACLADRFFSHRRDGRRTGRQALVAMRL